MRRALIGLLVGLLLGSTVGAWAQTSKLPSPSAIAAGDTVITGALNVSGTATFTGQIADPIGIGAAPASNNEAAVNIQLTATTAFNTTGAILRIYQGTLTATANGDSLAGQAIWQTTVASAGFTGLNFYRLMLGGVGADTLGGGGTIAEAASLYIANAPDMAATNKYAIRVAAGDTSLVALTASGAVILSNASVSFTGALPAAGGGKRVLCIDAATGAISVSAGALDCS